MANEASYVKRREVAREKAKRFARVVKETLHALTRDGKKVRQLRTTLEDAARRHAALDKEVRHLRQQLKAAEAGPDRSLVAKLAADLKVTTDRRDQIRKRLNDIEGRRDDLMERRRHLRKRLRRGITKRRFWRHRIKGAVRKLLHFRELKKQREKEQPTFEPWMANGADWQNSDQAVRNYIARAVVNGGLTCTSMNRTYVPAGGSTTSYHLQGKAGDAAGSWDRMVAFQLDEYAKGHGDSECLELFGPDNTHNLKYGSQLTLGEGEALETLHDTHVHEAR